MHVPSVTFRALLMVWASAGMEAGDSEMSVRGLGKMRVRRCLGHDKQGIESMQRG